MTELTNIYMSDGTVTFARTPYSEYQVDVTAWEDAERQFRDMFGDCSVPQRKRIVKIKWSLIHQAHLVKVFNRASRLNAVIVWRDGLPMALTSELQPLGKIYRFLLSAWGTTPPYIEVKEPENWVGSYSIKPVWEEP